MSNKIYKHICPFEEWRPDIENLSETLLLGPQAEILQLVESINQSFGLNLGITKTYRWSPGYMDQIKDYMVHDYVQIGMKRKISTFFNMIDQKGWKYSRFRKLLNELDDKMSRRRQDHAVFQDNSDILEEKIRIFNERIASQLIQANQSFNESGVRVSAAFYEKGFMIEGDDRTEDAFCIKVTLPASTMNVFVGREPYPIDISSCEIYLQIPYKELIYKLCSSTSTITEDTFLLNGFDATMGHTFGVYYPMWSVNNGGNLTHPYIGSANRWSGSIIQHGEREENAGSVCFGDLLDNVQNAMRRMDLVSLCATLIGWHSSFHVGRTHPLNGIKHSFMGLPKNCDTVEFTNALTVSVENCRNNSTASDLWSKDYCDYIDCAFKKTCTLYSFTNDNLGDLIEQSILEEEIVEEEGFQQYSDVDPGWERIQEDNETPEERVIRWASEHGGAINIGGRE